MYAWCVPVVGVTVERVIVHTMCVQTPVCVLLLLLLWLMTVCVTLQNPCVYACEHIYIYIYIYVYITIYIFAMPDMMGCTLQYSF